VLIWPRARTRNHGKSCSSTSGTSPFSQPAAVCGTHTSRRGSSRHCSVRLGSWAGRHPLVTLPFLLLHLPEEKIAYTLCWGRLHTEGGFNDRHCQWYGAYGGTHHGKTLSLIFSTHKKTNPTQTIHATQGHSLGASYATLCYAELLRLHTNLSLHATPPSFLLRDLYTFGSPRLALQDFTDALSHALHAPSPAQTLASSQTGHSAHNCWRILVAGDPVSRVPPVLLTDPAFVHLDGGAYELAEGEAPTPLESERGTRPRPPLVLVPDMSRHSEWSFWFLAEAFISPFLLFFSVFPSFYPSVFPSLSFFLSVFLSSFFTVTFLFLIKNLSTIIYLPSSLPRSAFRTYQGILR
jgi:hypothetical protein